MKKGLTLIEILVAAIILVLAVSSAAITLASIKRLSRRISYRYTALNLARDVLEFGESARFTTGFAMRYEYSTSSSRYRLTSYTGFDPSDPDPFDYIGDIKAKGLVPKGAPNSVVISYEVARDPNFYDDDRALVHTVRVTWREEPSDPEQKVVLGVLPIRQVNDQFMLTINEFWWD